MAESLAFWVEPINASEELANEGKTPKVDLHINYWLLNQNTDNEFHYLDFGIKFENLSRNSKLSLYFPFKVNKEEYVSGLGGQVCRRTELIQTIFNATHRSTKNIAPTYVEIEFVSEKEPALRVYTQIEIGDDPDSVNLIHFEKGSLLEFPMNLFPDCTEDSKELGPIPNYIRFRINLKGDKAKKCFSQSYKHRDNPVLSRLESTEIVDFRLNEVRDLPGNIQGKKFSNSFIKNIHFFLIREIDSEFKQAHAKFDRCRLLEKELWNAYLNLEDDAGKKSKLPHQMLIYHWKECASNPEKDKEASNSKEEYIEKFTAFAKFSKITASIKTVLTFAIIVVFLGMLSSIFGGWAQKYIDKKYEQIEPAINHFYEVHFK